MSEKRSFDDLTPEELERIARKIWKAKAAADAAITAAESGDAEAQSNLMLITADYLQAADDHISAYI